MIFGAVKNDGVEKDVFVEGEFFLHVFPVHYFCPLTSTKVLKLTKNTYCIHHFAGSWNEKTRKQLIKEWVVEHIVGRKLTDKIVQLKRKLRKK